MYKETHSWGLFHFQNMRPHKTLNASISESVQIYKNKFLHFFFEKHYVLTGFRFCAVKVSRQLLVLNPTHSRLCYIKYLV